MANDKNRKKRKRGLLQGRKVQWFFNFAYSIGAAIVIWGALFKILHLEGGNELLTIGMGTEIAMFVLTAFDRPPKEYEWEKVFPQLDEREREALEHAAEELGIVGNHGAHPGVYANGGSGAYYGTGGYSGPTEVTHEKGEEGEDNYDENSGATEYDNEDYQSPGHSGGPTFIAGNGPTFVAGNGPTVVGGGAGVVFAGGAGNTSAEGASDDAEINSATGETPVGTGGVIVAGGSMPGSSSGLNISEEDTNSLRESISKMAAAADQLSQMAELTTATQDYLERISGIAEQMTQLQDTTAELNKVSSILLDSYRAITENSASISESSNGYVERMADLNRNIGGLNTIYEIQLKSISSQLESIDRVNRGLKDIRDMYEKSARQSSRYCEETERMTRYMTQLNSVYEKMVTAMTINMYNPMMGQPRPNDDFNPYEQSDNGNDRQQEAN